MADKNQLLEEANQALQRMQTFDVETLPRVVELGQDINFQSAVDPAKRLVDLYKRLAANSLDDLSQTALQQLKDRANNDFSLFKQALDFKLATQSNPQSTRDSIVGQIASSYDQSFQILHPYIAYSLHRSADFQRLDSDARSTMQSISDRADEVTKNLKSARIKREKVSCCRRGGHSTIRPLQSGGRQA